MSRPRWAGLDTVVDGDCRVDEAQVAAAQRQVTEDCELYRAIEGLPASEFRGGVVLVFFELLSAGIRPLPVVASTISDRREQAPRLCIEQVAVLHVSAHHIEEVSLDAQL